MSVRGAAERAGELFMFGFEGTTIDDVPLDLLAQAGGVILFKRNIQNPRQVKALTDGICNATHKAGVPPIVAIDQEGGTVSRLDSFGTTTPSAMALGAARDPSLTESMYSLIGDELAALGITVDLAPVADVNNNPQNPVVGLRSFGDDPATVGLHVRAAIRGLRAAGVAATAKHFPGHGDTTVDSHLQLPRIPHGLARVRAVEFVPFVSAIAEHVDMIMTAHVLFEALEESGLPATLSQRILTGLLRAELKFEGVICTDCMEMQAIESHAPPRESAPQAVQAGADLVLFSHTPDKVRSAIAAVREGVERGDISEQRVTRALERTHRLRSRLAAAFSGQRPPLEVLGSQAHEEAALAAARLAVTLVRDPRSVIPLNLNKSDRLLVVEFAGDAVSAVEDGQRRARTAIGPALARGPARLHEQVRSLDPAGHEYKQLLMAAGTAHAVVALTSRANQHPLQARAVADLAMLGKRMVVVIGREPYDALVIPQEATVIASFGEDPHAMRAAADVIFGDVTPTGKLPVTLRTTSAAS